MYLYCICIQKLNLILNNFYMKCMLEDLAEIINKCV